MMAPCVSVRGPPSDCSDAPTKAFGRIRAGQVPRAGLYQHGSVSGVWPDKGQGKTSHSLANYTLEKRRPTGNPRGDHDYGTLPEKQITDPIETIDGGLFSPLPF
jgi:hypothetical protein